MHLQQVWHEALHLEILSGGVGQGQERLRLRRITRGIAGDEHSRIGVLGACDKGTRPHPLMHAECCFKMLHRRFPPLQRGRQQA